MKLDYEMLYYRKKTLKRFEKEISEVLTIAILKLDIFLVFFDTFQSSAFLNKKSIMVLLLFFHRILWKEIPFILIRGYPLKKNCCKKVVWIVYLAMQKKLFYSTAKFFNFLDCIFVWVFFIFSKLFVIQKR